MQVGIVGMGKVGQAMFDLFKDHYQVRGLDDDGLGNEDSIEHWKYHFYDAKRIVNVVDNLDENLDYIKNRINDCDVVFVCVPTPQDQHGSCDTSIVREVIDWLDVPLIVIKSTVSPGTTDELMFAGETKPKSIVFSPEYCGESSYWTPYKFHLDIVETPFFIFGGEPEDTSKCVDLFMKVCGPTKRYIQTTAKAAELAKYAENTFYATKIAFSHEIKEICDAHGEDYNEVRELWLADPRLNPMHTAVFEGSKEPFGGKCLPKDLSALIMSAKSVGYEPELLKEVRKTNKRIGEMRREKE